jgi:hypothetical protein
MNSPWNLVVAPCAILWLAAPVFAESPGISTAREWENETGAVLYVLEGAAAAALERAQMNKGSRKSLCLMKNVELEDLIERLENGDRLTSREVEDAVDGLLGPQLGFQSVAFSSCD